MSTVTTMTDAEFRLLCYRRRRFSWQLVIAVKFALGVLR
jgi:hypothetical protein